MATPFSITSFRGGMNDEDPSHSLPDDQVVRAENVEFWKSTLGERRLGMAALSLAGSGLDTRHEIVHLAAHLPLASAIVNSELFGASVTIGTGWSFARKAATGVWTTISPTDAPVTTSPDVYQLDSHSTQGMLFVCYKSAVSRMHVWDGTTFRRVGLAPPLLAPTAANSGVAGGVGTIMLGARTYRVRFVKMTGAVVNLMSEPSPELIFSPNQLDDGIVVTRPALVNEGETHWDLEASDGSNFYRLARTVIGTTTATDQTYIITNYADHPLSESIGDYSVLPPAKYVKADQDHLIFFGNHDDPTKGSQLGWSTNFNATGFGNAERQPTRYDSFLELGNKDGGDATGLSDPVLGAYYAFKWSHIFKVQRTQQPNEAYEALLVTDQHGAIPGSVISGVDEFGRGCIYFLNPSSGPMRLSAQGLQQLKGLNTTWRSVNTAASKIVAHGIFLPTEQQVKWWVATESENTPNFVIVSHVDEIRATVDGASRGWAIATGTMTSALCSTTLPETHIDEITGATTLSYRPYLGFSTPHFIQKGNIGDDDDGDSYEALIRSKPYMPAGLLGKFEVTMGALLAVPNTNPGVQLDITLIRDFGKDKQRGFKVVTLDFTPDGDEELVIKEFDNLKLGEIAALQIEFADHDNPVGGRWELHRFDLQQAKQGGLGG